MADPAIPNEFAVNVTLMPQVGPPVSGQWGLGQVIFDSTGEMYICIQASDLGGATPAVWKHLSGGGGTPNIVVENLTSQITGSTYSYTTSQDIVAGTLQAFVNGQDLGTPGTIAGGAHLEQTGVKAFDIDVLLGAGEELHVRYFTP